MDLYCVVFLLLICFQTICVESSLNQYSFHENCGRTLYPAEVAGEVTFRSRAIHDAGYRTRHCEVIISPKVVKTNVKNRILFYFTEFNIGRRCSNNNLTIIDGRHQTTHIQGLPDVLCGHNTSLENNSTIFTSQQSDIRLIYQWSEYGNTFSGQFKLIFIAFYDGPCVSESGVFGCNNNRCISTNISCQDGLNPCGNGQSSDCATPATDTVDVISKFLESVPGFLAIVGVIVGLFLAKKFVYDKLVRRYGSIKNVPVIKLLFEPRIFRDVNPRPATRRRSTISEPDLSVFDDHTSISSMEFDSISLSINNRTARIETARNRTDTTSNRNDTTRNRNDTTHNRNDTTRNRNETIEDINATSHDRNETSTPNNSDLPTYDTFINDTQRFPPTAPESSYSPPEPTAPPSSSDGAPPPSYADVMADNDKYVMR